MEYQIKRCDFSKKEHIPVYKSLTKEKYFPYLESTDNLVYGVEALYRTQPVALLLATYNADGQYTDIHSIIVHKEHRKKGIATALVKFLEKELTNLGCSLFLKKYNASYKHAPNLEKLLKQLGWTGPTTATVQYHFDSFLFNPDWIKRHPKLPPTFKELLWKQLKKEEIDTLKKQESLLPSPFGIDDKSIDPEYSLVLFHKKKIVGWMITHRVKPDTIRYTSLYIHPEWRYKGYAIKLLIDVINKQKKQRIPWALFEIDPSQTGEVWKLFIQKRLAAHAHAITKIKQFYKRIV